LAAAISSGVIGTLVGGDVSSRMRIAVATYSAEQCFAAVFMGCSGRGAS